MKKLLPAAFLCLALLLSSCGGADELKNPLTLNQETHDGTFTSLGSINVNPKVTHLFETDDGDILYAYSDRYDLNDKEYLGIRVEAYGAVSTYENLDKPLFEVKRITDAPEEVVTEEITPTNYQNVNFGFSFTYLSSWKLEEGIDSVTLTAPTPAVAEESTATTTTALDSISIVRLPAGLKTTASDEQSVRSAEIVKYVEQEYADLAIFKSDTSYLGTDQLFSVRYKTESRDIYYFVPRETYLYEISFNHESGNETALLDNTNAFSNLVASFRFVPVLPAPPDGSTVTDDTGTDTTNVDDTTDTTGSTDTTSDANTTTQVVFAKYASFSSNFGFSISYPSPWYYRGSSSSYKFSDKDLEEGGTVIVTLTWSSSGSAGVNRTSTAVTVTALVDGKYYSLTGSPAYESTMQAMADSIKSVEA